MSTVRELEESLYRLAPRHLAVEWDNVGHLLGDPDQPVSRILVALDITEAVAAEAAAKGCQLIVAHHPVMNCKWQQVQTVRDDTPQGHLLLGLLRNRISAICMHTNLDAAEGGVNDALAEVLRLEDPGPFTDDKIGRCGLLPEPQGLREFVRFVSRSLGCGGVRYASAGKPVRQVAVGGGACGDYADAAVAAGCDTFVTADLSYHQFLDAAGKGINLIDAGHFPTEDPVCAKLISYISQNFPGIAVEKSTSHREVIQYYVEGE